MDETQRKAQHSSASACNSACRPELSSMHNPRFSASPLMMILSIELVTACGQYKLPSAANSNSTPVAQAPSGESQQQDRDKVVSVGPAAAVAPAVTQPPASRIR